MKLLNDRWTIKNFVIVEDEKWLRNIWRWKTIKNFVIVEDDVSEEGHEDEDLDAE